MLRDVEDRLLRLVEDDPRLLLRLERGMDDAVAGVDEVPEDRLLLDDAAPLLDVGDAGDAVDERRQVRGAADRLQRGAPYQLVLERDEVDGLGALGERGHRVEDPAVGLAVEVVAGEDLRR